MISLKGITKFYLKLKEKCEEEKNQTFYKKIADILYQTETTNLNIVIILFLFFPFRLSIFLIFLFSIFNSGFHLVAVFNLNIIFSLSVNLIWIHSSHLPFYILIIHNLGPFGPLELAPRFSRDSEWHRNFVFAASSSALQPVE